MFSFLAIHMPSAGEMAVILLIIFLLFGAKRLPELARGIGKSMGEFRKARDEFNKELEDAQKELEKPAVPQKKVASDDVVVSRDDEETKA